MFIKVRLKIINLRRRVIYKIKFSYLTEIIEKFEITLKTPKSNYVNFPKLSTTTGDFHMNYTKFLLKHYPTIYSKESNA